MKKLEQKKKDKLDKQKPFDLNTERRNKEKEEKDIKNPVIGSIKILVNPGKDGILYIREGADPNKLATSFINSYSLKKEQKESIVLEINRIIEQYKMKQLRKINESNNNLGNRSMLNEIKFITEGSNSTNEMNYFNIPQSKNEYIDRFKMPINYAVASSNDVENEDPNEHLMSPYFRGNLAENVPRFNQMKDNTYYEDIGMLN